MKEAKFTWAPLFMDVDSSPFETFKNNLEAAANKYFERIESGRNPNLKTSDPNYQKLTEAEKQQLFVDCLLLDASDVTHQKKDIKKTTVPDESLLQRQESDPVSQKLLAERVSKQKNKKLGMNLLQYAIFRGKDKMVSHILDQIELSTKNYVDLDISNALFYIQYYTGEPLTPKFLSMLVEKFPAVITSRAIKWEVTGQDEANAVAGGNYWYVIRDALQNNYQACLIAAITAGDHTVLSKLLAPDLLEQFGADCSPVHLVAAGPYDLTSVVEELLRRPEFKADQLDANGDTVLHIAARNNNIHILRMLAHQSDLNYDIYGMQNRAGETATEIARRNYEKVQNANGKKSKLDATETVNELYRMGLDIEPVVDDTPDFEEVYNAGHSKITKFVLKGGGIKGLAYLGCLQEGVEQQLFRLEEIDGVAGTSAGAITASVLALTNDLEVAKQTSLSVDFAEFLDFYDKRYSEDLIKDLKSAYWKKTYAVFKYFRGDITKAIALLNKHAGACRGEVPLQWLRKTYGRFAYDKLYAKYKDTIAAEFDGFVEQRKAEGGDVSDERALREELLGKYLTFADFKLAGFKNLKVFGANLNRHRSEEFSFDKTPDTPVADAVRTSMSLPVIYTPHFKYIVKKDPETGLYYRHGPQRQEDGTYLKDKEGYYLIEHRLKRAGSAQVEIKHFREQFDQFMDGGLLDNYPITAFDDGGPNPEVLGFCLASSGARHELEFQAQAQRRDIEDEDFFAVLRETMDMTLFQQQDNIQLKQRPEDRYRSVYPDPLDIGTTEFDLEAERREKLTHQGRVAIRRFMDRRAIPFKPYLSNDTMAHLSKLGVIHSSHFNERISIKAKFGVKLDPLDVAKVYARVLKTDGELQQQAVHNVQRKARGLAKPAYGAKVIAREFRQLKQQQHRELATLKRLVNPNQTDQFGITALHIARAYGLDALATCLLQHNASASKEAGIGMTASHDPAALCKYIEKCFQKKRTKIDQNRVTQNKKARLASELTETTKELERTTQERERVRDEAQQAERQISKSIADKEQQLEAALAEVEALQHQGREANQAHNTAQTDLNDQIDGLQNQISDLNDQITDLEEQLRTANTDYTVATGLLDDEIDDLKAQIERMKAAAQETNRAHVAEVDGLNGDIQGLRQQLEQANNKNARQERENASLQQLNQALQADNVAKDMEALRLKLRAQLQQDVRNFEHYNAAYQKHNS